MPDHLEIERTVGVSAIRRTYGTGRGELMAGERGAVIEVLSSANAREGALSFLE